MKPNGCEKREQHGGWACLISLAKCFSCFTVEDEMDSQTEAWVVGERNKMDYEVDRMDSSVQDSVFGEAESVTNSATMPKIEENKLTLDLMSMMK